MAKLQKHNFYSQIVDLLQSAQLQVIRTVNQTMVVTYFEVGRMIIEEEQKGYQRAAYGKAILKELSTLLTKEFGKGFSKRNLEQMRKFYLVYTKTQTVSALFQNADNKRITAINHESNTKVSESQNYSGKPNFNLSWSHYLTLIRIDNEDERKFYEIESAKNNWSVRELKRQYDTALYTRLTLSRNKEKIKELSVLGQIVQTAQDAIKDPLILEFLGLPENSDYSENELEQRIIDKLEHFLLELGNGFTFVARQKRISFDDKHFYIDLVFYNRILKSFVLIDLKIGELKHQDIGQMQMYVNYYDRKIKLEDENKTIGIILCQNKSESVVEFTLPEGNKTIFASKYDTVLPSKDDLMKLMEDPASYGNHI